MFRIKPVRNLTVAKQSNISPHHSINFTIKKPIVQPINLKKLDKLDIKDKPIDINLKNKIHNVNIQRQSFLPQQQNKKISSIKPKPKVEVKTLKNQIIKQHKLNLFKKSQHQQVYQKVQIQKDQKQKNHQAQNQQTYKDHQKIQVHIRHPQLSQNIKNQSVHKNKIEIIQSSIQKAQNQNQMISKMKQEDKKKKQMQQNDAIIIQKMYEIQNNLKKKQEQATTFAQNNLKKLQSIKVLRIDQKQENQKNAQIQKQKQHEMLLEKINKRREARQKEKQRKIELQKKRQENQEKAKEIIQNRQQIDFQSGQPLGGMIRLNDQLEHFGMAEAIMDLQVKKLLKMKFDAFPNKSQIQYQLQELDRINRSYLMVRDQENNSLIPGLHNYRIEIFNKIGNLILQAQNQGFQNSNFHIIEANRNTNIPGISISRGLPQQSHQKLLKRVKVKAQEDCTICLHALQINDQGFQVKCGHIFHQNCIKQWIQNSANCPTCRYNIKFG